MPNDYIMPNRLDRGYARYSTEFNAKALEVLKSGRYILGPELTCFEEEFAHYLGAKHCVGVASGLDALWIAFRLLNIGTGDEVIVPGNTYIASVMGVTINGATPVFVEPDEYFNIDSSGIEKKITKRTRAILVVHLYGQAADMNSVTAIANRYGLKIVEDCAQSHGAKFDGRTTGTFGDIGCFSFYPSKNIGAFGDAGAIVTEDPKLAADARVFRNYGSEKRYYNQIIGANSRLDELQAALLRVRLAHARDLEEERKALAERYLKGIVNPQIHLPRIRPGATHVWHQFVIRVSRRQELIPYLEKRGIGTIIHYPIPPHLSAAYAYLGLRRGALPITEQYADEVLSLPFYAGMTEAEQKHVINALNEF